jgi:hypothetical protein
MPISRLGVQVVLSNADLRQPLNVAREKELIQSTMGAVPNIDLRFLEPPTIEQLGWEVQRQPFEILHFVGHGRIDNNGNGTILLGDSSGGGIPISGAILAETLRTFPANQARLVVLNACSTANLPRTVDGHDPFQGTASALILAGIPAVVAMQFPISDRAALSFSGAFYRSLAAGDPLEAAVAAGRGAILRAQPNSWEWATPVLYLRVPDGQLFAISRQGKQDQKARRARYAAPVAIIGRLTELDQLDPARKREILAQRQAEVRQVPEQARFHFDLGVSYLELRLYDQALTSLKEALNRGCHEPGLNFYLALANVGGKELRQLSLSRIKETESYLKASLGADGDTPEGLLLSAIIKHDYYRAKKFRVESPQVEDLLEAIRRSRASAGDLHLIARHIAVTPALRERLPRNR